MDFILLLLFIFALMCVAGWIVMLIAGALGVALGYWTCVGVCIGLYLLRILIF